MLVAENGVLYVPPALHLFITKMCDCIIVQASFFCHKYCNILLFVL